MVSSVYTITSPSGGQYIGSAVNFPSRRRVHRHLLMKGKHHNPGLQRAVTKYGIDNLKFSILLICRRADLIFFEQRAIDVLRPRYNACPTAGSRLGTRMSPETNARLAALMRGRRQSAEQRAALSRRMMGNTIMSGRRLSAEHRAKIGAAGKGKLLRPYSPNERAEMAAKYRGGLGLLDLCSIFKSDHRKIRRTLIAEGVAIRPRGKTIAQGG